MENSSRALIIRYNNKLNGSILYKCSDGIIPKEIEEAKKEGVKFVFQNNIVKIIGNEKVEKVEKASRKEKKQKEKLSRRKEKAGKRHFRTKESTV